MAALVAMTVMKRSGGSGGGGGGSYHSAAEDQEAITDDGIKTVIVALKRMFTPIRSGEDPYWDDGFLVDGRNILKLCLNNISVAFYILESGPTYNITIQQNLTHSKLKCTSGAFTLKYPEQKVLLLHNVEISVQLLILANNLILHAPPCVTQMKMTEIKQEKTGIIPFDIEFKYTKTVMGLIPTPHTETCRIEIHTEDPNAATLDGIVFQNTKAFMDQINTKIHSQAPAIHDQLRSIADRLDNLFF